MKQTTNKLFINLFALALIASTVIYATYSVRTLEEQHVTTTRFVLAVAEGISNTIVLAADVFINLGTEDKQIVIPPADTTIIIPPKYNAPVIRGKSLAEIHAAHVSSFRTKQPAKAPTEADLPPLNKEKAGGKTSNAKQFNTKAAQQLYQETYAKATQQNNRVIIIPQRNTALTGEQYGNLIITQLTKQEIAAITVGPAAPYTLITPDYPVSAQTLDFDERIQGPLARNTTNTSGAVGVCIIDSGINYTLSAFNLNYVGGTDFVNNDSDPMDDYGHGTQMTSILLGVAPGAQVYSAKVLNNTGGGYTSDVIKAVDWCMQQNVSVISMSLTAGQYDSWCDDASLMAQKANEAASRGFIVVAAAGNYQPGVMGSPACGSLVTSVAATHTTDEPERLLASSGISNVTDLLAPGTAATVLTNNGSSVAVSGTSVAAAVTAGAAAVLTENNRTNIPSLLQQTGVLVTVNDTNYSRIDVYNAVQNYSNNYTFTQIGYQSANSAEVLTPALCTCNDNCAGCPGQGTCSGTQIVQWTCLDIECVSDNYECAGAAYCQGGDVYVDTCSGGSCVQQLSQACTGPYCSGTDVYTNACSGGSCSNSFVQSCTDTCDAWSGVCNQDSPGTCSTAGTEYRTCYAAACSAGGCTQGSSYQDSRACTYPTNGDSCGADSCGACSYGDVCDNAGSRTCTPQVCSGGSCVAGTPYTDYDGCARNTDGTWCDGTYTACSGSCAMSNTDYLCSSGLCNNPSVTTTYAPVAGRVCSGGSWVVASCSANCGYGSSYCSGSNYLRNATGCAVGSNTCNVATTTACTAPAGVIAGGACTCSGECTTSVCKNSVFDGTVTSSICVTDNTYCVDNTNAQRASGTTVGDSACFGSTSGGSVWLAANGRYVVKNTTGAVLAVIDKYGSFGVRGTVTASASTFDGGWQVKNSTGSVRASINNTNGNFRTASTITVRAVPSCTGFQVKNTAGTLEACISSTGVVTLRGDYAYNLTTLS